MLGGFWERGSDSGKVRNRYDLLTPIQPQATPAPEPADGKR